MATVIRKAPIEDIPEAWREGLGDRSVVEITLRVESAAPSSPDKLEKALDAVCGIWKDRDDLDETFQGIRSDLAHRHRKLFSLA